MGYFSNGTEGESYQAEHCAGCIHNEHEGGCSVWFLHMLHNYAECNKPDSFLHILIPRSKDGLGNEICSMYAPTLKERLLFPTHCDRCGETYHGGPCKGAPHG